MSGAAMRLTAATSGLVFLLLSASVIRAQNDRRGNYYPTRVCALKGSTVNLLCGCAPPRDSPAERSFWFTETQGQEPADLRTDPEYAGRVQFSRRDDVCTLTIADLRDSDSAEYKFRSAANRPGLSNTGEPAVTLSVTGFHVQISESSQCKTYNCVKADLTCLSSCLPTRQTSFSWYKNGVKISTEKKSFRDYFYPADSYSCAAEGYEAFPSPSVCVTGTYCNSVTYADRRICAFKGSSVNISCTYSSYESFAFNKFWFKPERPEDLRQDPRYEGRVHVLETKRGRSTLTISDLRGSDSAEYRFKFNTRSFEWRSSLPGTTLTVTEPDVQVQAIWSSTGPKLICHSSCLPPGRSSFVWYQNETKKIPDETSSSYGGRVDPADSYSCAYQSYRSPPVYAPRVPSVLASRDGDIMEGSSVNLSCSSDANPAASYTWHKENQPLLRQEPQLVFTSIQSSDSGQYHCTAENQLGRTSKSISIDVKYAPKLPSVSVSPSAEMVEGSSVTLTCSSDANPAASYTWYKKNQTLLQGSEGVYRFTSISSEDSGIYYCKSENKHGEINSTSLVLDVQYAPKLPSVSVSPSAEIVEGSSVTLTCSSDANPAASYTWYKEDEDSPKASGQIFTITDFRAEHSGSYSCAAQNTRGRSSSALHVTVAGAWKKSAAAGSIAVVLLAVALLAALLWMRRKKSITQQSDGRERTDNRAQLTVDPEYDVASAPAPAAEHHLHYSSLRFAHKPEEALYSNVRPARPREEEDEEEEVEEVDYTNVKTDSASGAPRTRREEDEDGSFALYSTVNK